LSSQLPEMPPGVPTRSSGLLDAAADERDDRMGLAAELLERALFEVKRVVVGQHRMLERMMVCLLARGHCLLEGVPGLAKTLTVETLARIVGGKFVRIQFTPDLVPSDIVGTMVYRPSQEEFVVALGPIFANFVLADEINRAPAKVQSALLEVMSERQVSIGGTTYPAPDPFYVLATQNPIEAEGVYPLPEAQRDRFLLKILVPYPTPTEELEIINRMGVNRPVAHHAVLEPNDLFVLQQATDRVFVDSAIAEYAVRIVFATRDPGAFGLEDLVPVLEFGASPRASLGLIAATRALALLRGRDYALPEDLTDICPDVLRHRLVLSFEATADGVDVEEVITRLLDVIAPPGITPGQERAEASRVSR
jgi:MoxR-like ATPase